MRPHQLELTLLAAACLLTPPVTRVDAGGLLEPDTTRIFLAVEKIVPDCGVRIQARDRTETAGRFLGNTAESVRISTDGQSPTSFHLGDVDRLWSRGYNVWKPMAIGAVVGAVATAVTANWDALKGGDPDPSVGSPAAEPLVGALAGVGTGLVVGALVPSWIERFSSTRWKNDRQRPLPDTGRRWIRERMRPNIELLGGYSFQHKSAIGGARLLWPTGTTTSLGVEYVRFSEERPTRPYDPLVGPVTGKITLDSFQLWGRVGLARRDIQPYFLAGVGPAGQRSSDPGLRDRVYSALVCPGLLIGSGRTRATLEGRFQMFLKRTDSAEEFGDFSAITLGVQFD